MVNAGRFFGAAALAGVAAATTACLDSGPDRVVVVDQPTGTLTVEYTIQGGKVPSDCVFYGATDVELVVYDSLGYFVTDRYAPCESFFVSVQLYPGRYGADVTLVDRFNYAASVTAPLYDLDVVRDTELVVSVDFPPGSFL